MQTSRSASQTENMQDLVAQFSGAADIPISGSGYGNGDLHRPHVQQTFSLLE